MYRREEGLGGEEGRASPSSAAGKSSRGKEKSQSRTSSPSVKDTERGAGAGGGGGGPESTSKKGGVGSKFNSGLPSIPKKKTAKP